MAKTKEFELQGFLIGDPKYPDAKPGDILKLEVGHDDLPTSVLLRSRVRPLGDRLDAGDGISEDEAKGKAKEIVDKAKAKAADIVKDAEEKAKKVVADAEASVDEYVKESKEKADQQAAEILDKANTDAATLLAAAKS